MEAHTTGPENAYDRVKQRLRAQTDRPAAVREAVYACRKGVTGPPTRCPSTTRPAPTTFSNTRTTAASGR
ncbi:hypothetical protein GCM10009727_57020 [Actinomadura napierensis]|uniref:Transposase n=1 Tax=Actinomadura napierensis TaxID=267854 RepID=A0ABN3A166_9ACTN